ncbi:MAG: Ig-like domain-containing protein [Bacteroidetes bacterium]|nr:Ig-like domain-containing protein [Bacteroidota bacterium]
MSLLWRCAQVLPLTGGKRDILPPKLITSLPKHLTTNFVGSTITLYFDEFVQLKNLNSQLIISPKLTTDPDISAVGKSVVIKIKPEELKPNTTYRFDFGNSIADMHESNQIKQFDFVFSTGSAIDTLQLKGSLTENFTAKNIPNMLVGLYNSNEQNDSFPYIKQPVYYCKSNEDGLFNFSYLPKSAFKVFSFNDNNKNFLFDGESEKLAFLNDSFNLESDSNIKLNVFKELPTKNFIKKTLNPYYGYTVIVYNKKEKYALTLNSDSVFTKYYTSHSKDIDADTIQLYYATNKDSLKILITRNDIVDTINLRLPKKNTKQKKINPPEVNLIGNLLPLTKQFVLKFNSLIDTSKSVLSKIKLIEKSDSSGKEIPFKLNWLSPIRAEISSKLKEGKKYNLIIDTATFFSYSHLYNDSLKFSFITDSAKNYGNLFLNLTLNTKQDYVVQLINENENVVKENYVSLSLSASNTTKLNYPLIQPGIYRVKIIYDNNSNKKWDTGNFLKKIQPERIIINSKQLKVVSDWDLEEEITIRE